MKIRILGSGGFLRIPRACCQCNICVEARKKGMPYERLGSSVFIEEEEMLIDASEDINTELNKHGIKGINHLFFSHWHPDHTAGVRFLEVLRAERKEPPVNVYLTERLKNDFQEKIPSIFYFEKTGYCKIILADKVKVGKLEIHITALKNGFAHAFVIKEGKKKVAICPCHCMELSVTEELKNADLLIMNLGYFGKEERNISGFEKDNLRLIRELKPKKAVLTHIEENWGKNYDEYCKLEEKYKKYNLKFAYDGMKIEV